MAVTEQVGSSGDVFSRCPLRIWAMMPMILNEYLFGSLQCIKANAGEVLQIKYFLLSSTPLVHFRTTTLPLDAM
jgi:hypothetical protein